MIVSAKLNALLSAQIGHELENSNRYIAIASYFEGECLFGLAKIYFKQAEEEREHAMKFVKFLLEAGGKVVVPPIPAPPSEFATAEAAAQSALDSELRTTEEIYTLVELATAEKNYIAVNFLQWFVSEQLEEISSAQTRLSVIRRRPQRADGRSLSGTWLKEMLVLAGSNQALEPDGPHAAVSHRELEGRVDAPGIGHALARTRR